MYTVKAFKVGDNWELDVLAIPFGGRDSDNQYFDASTDIMPDVFTAPAIVYYHGVNPDGRNVQNNPPLIGKSVRVEKKADGWHVRVLLDKAHEYAKRIWEAAKLGMAAASSGSIAHLARLEGGKMYDKNQPGRIAVWPFAELSLIDIGDGRRPANPYAVALPVMKSVYKQAGIALPENIEEPQEPEAVGDTAAESEDTSTKSNNGENLMDEKEKKEGLTQEDVAATVAAALKADRDAREAEAKAEAEKQALIDEEVKKQVEAAKADFAKNNRLPSHKGPYVAKYGDISKYDNVSPEDQAVLVGILQSAKRSNQSVYGASEEAVKALAVKMLEDSDSLAAADARYAMKAAGVATKTDEVMQQNLTSYGNEWVGVAYSTALWRSIRKGTFVLDRIPSIQIPAGHESIVIPLESTDPTYYKVAETEDHDSTMGFPVASVSSSRVGTTNKTLNLAKMGARVAWSGEMEEDSLIPFVSQLRAQLAVSGAEYLESAIIDGDTATATITNINDIAATAVQGGTEHYLLFNGLRKSALVTTTANSRDGGVLDIHDFLETIKLMGTAGINALDIMKVSFILDPHTNYKALALPEVLTRDVNTQATVENGLLSKIFGYDVNISGAMHKVSANRKVNSAGKIDQDSTANNTKGAILAARWDQWMFGWRRRMTMEVTRYPRSDSSEIVALMRCGLIQRDTEASAISYNITV